MNTGDAPLRRVVAACRGVTVVYDSSVKALDNIDLEIDERDSLALLGRSGSGKTTLLHALGGLVEPSSGTVEWKGAPLSSLDSMARGAIRSHGIAYVFQGANLLPHFTALENVAFAAHLCNGGAGSRAALSPLSLLELVGLSSRADHLPAELSGGEAQRVAIARAIAQEPELLLCDEPTGHLDAESGERVLELIEALQNELGFGLVVATHDTDVASRLGREIELLDGQVVAVKALT